jgi:hypothetical protein
MKYSNILVGIGKSLTDEYQKENKKKRFLIIDRYFRNISG